MKTNWSENELIDTTSYMLEMLEVHWFHCTRTQFKLIFLQGLLDDSHPLFVGLCVG